MRRGKRPGVLGSQSFRRRHGRGRIGGEGGGFRSGCVAVEGRRGGGVDRCGKCVLERGLGGAGFLFLLIGKSPCGVFEGKRLNARAGNAFALAAVESASGVEARKRPAGREKERGKGRKERKRSAYRGR